MIIEIYYVISSQGIKLHSNLNINKKSSKEYRNDRRREQSLPVDMMPFWNSGG